MHTSRGPQLSAYPAEERLRVRLESSTTEGERIDVNFWLDYFDFPMVNNTHLSDAQRCAIVLKNLDHESGADLALVYFPGSYASLRDKPLRDEILSDLKSKASREAGHRDQGGMTAQAGVAPRTLFEQEEFMTRPGCIRAAPHFNFSSRLAIPCVWPGQFLPLLKESQRSQSSLCRDPQRHGQACFRQP